MSARATVRALDRPIDRAGATRRGLTLVELLIAMGLLALLFTAVISTLDGSLRLWDKTETRRELVDEASGVLELLTGDLRATDGGPRGDLLCEWVSFDTTGDGGRDSLWPRLRLVRYVSDAELARLFAGAGAAQPDARGEGLLEVVWALAPAFEPAEMAADEALRAEGVVWRGERLVGADGVSIFERGYFRTDGRPVAGGAGEVTGGVLWLGFGLATQTTVLAHGWSFGDDIGQAGTSWDAWRRGRPDETITSLNRPPNGMPADRGRALLPRRVRVEVEIERERDRRRRTRLEQPATVNDVRLSVDDGDRLPARGRYVKIGSEWMEVLSVEGGSVGVKRGQRGTLSVGHARGELVHWGLSMVREVRIPASQEDWDL